MRADGIGVDYVVTLGERSFQFVAMVTHARPRNDRPGTVEIGQASAPYRVVLIPAEDYAAQVKKYSAIANVLVGNPAPQSIFAHGWSPHIITSILVDRLGLGVGRSA